MKERTPIVSEFCIQSTFIECLAHLKPNCVYFAVPNEAKRSLAEGARMKKLGLHPGAADVIFLAKGGSYAIEFKTVIGVQNKEQKDFEQWCLEHGTRYTICRNVRDGLWTVSMTWGLISSYKLHPFLAAFKEPETHA